MIERRTVDDLRGLRAAYNAIYARAEFGEREALYAQILDLLAPPPAARILDVGCGAGPFLSYARERGFGPVGLDLSDEGLRKAKLRGNRQLILGQGERLPLPSEAFTRIVCLGNLEHFLDPLAGARELARVLSPEGVGVIMLPNRYYSGDLWRLLTTGRGPNHHQAIDRFGSDGEWRRLLDEGGLAVDVAQRWDKGKRWKRIFPFQLAYHFVYRVRKS